MRSFFWGAIALLVIACAPTAAVAHSDSRRVPVCPPSVLLHLEEIKDNDPVVLLPDGTRCRWYAAMVPWCRQGEVKSPDGKGDCHQRR